MSLKKRWERELSTTLPPLDEKTKSMPIPSRDTPSQRRKSFNLPRASRISAVVTALIVIALIPVLLFVNKGGDGGEDGGVYFGKSIITVEINPSITLITDNDGKVTAVKSANADGDLMVASADFKSRVIGKTIGDAAIEFVNEAHALGFADGATKLKISTYDDDENKKTVESLKKYIEEKMSDVITETNILENVDFLMKNGLPETSSMLDLLNSRDLFIERELTDEDTDAIRAAYKSILDTEKIRGMLIEKYNSISDKNADFAERLAAIRAKNDEIKSLSPLSLDYFVYELMGTEIEDDEISAAVGEMREMLNAFHIDYGIEIIAAPMLDAIENIYEDFEALGIYDIIMSIELESLADAAAIIDALNQYGEDTEEIESILTPPTSLEQFNQKYTDALKIRYEELKLQNSK